MCEGRTGNRFLLFVTFPRCQIGIAVSLAFSVVATAVLSDLWGKEWTTLLLSFQVTLLLLLLLFLPSSFAPCGFHFLTPDSVSCPDQVTAPFLHLGGALLMTALAWPIALHFFRLSSRGEALSLFVILV